MNKLGLFVSAYFPSISVPAAGNRLSALALSEISSRNEIVDVVTFCNSFEKEYVKNSLFPDNIRLKLFEITILHRIISAIIYPLTPFGSSVRKILGKNYIKNILDKNEYSEIYIDFVQSSDTIPRKYLPQSFLRVHDVLSQLYERHAFGKGIRKYAALLELFRVRRWEARILKNVGAIITLNDKDETIIRKISGRSDICVEFPENYYRVSGRSHRTIDPDMILFWANYSRYENVDAAQYFIDEIFPIIEREIPTCRVVFLGANPPTHMMRGCRDRIEWTGFVGDPTPYFLRCAVGVVPMRLGAGIKIKTLEFLGSGIETISTSVGAEGIAPQKLLHVEDIPQNFAKRCIEILNSAQKHCSSPDGA